MLSEIYAQRNFNVAAYTPGVYKETAMTAASKPTRRRPSPIIPFPGKARHHSGGPDDFTMRLAALKATFDQSAATGKPVEFAVKIPAGLFGALVTEAATYRMDVFEIARHMLRMGLDRFDAEELVWSGQDTSAPDNVTPLRFIRNVVKDMEDETPLSS